MIRYILELSVRRRWVVMLLCFAAAAFGAWALVKLPIDAVPDITNNQVQINLIAPALSPLEVEKQVTFPVETALAGIPGLEVDPVVFAQWLCADHGDIQRPNESVFRAAASQRTPDRSQGRPASGRGTQDGADIDRPWRNLLVGG